MSQTSNTPFDELARWARKAVEGIAKQFTEPDDDFLPSLLLARSNGERVLVALDPAMIANKDVMAYVVGSLVEKSDSVAAAFVSSAWTLKLDAKDRASYKPGMNLEHHPDRQEEVFIYLADEDHATMFRAGIVRDGKTPPTLAEWQDFGEEGGEKMTGRFPEAVRGGIGRARRNRTDSRLSA